MDSSIDQTNTLTRSEQTLVFNGKAGEYFRIWIVNTLLTLLTLGIYSAWAKVRTNRYFYGNTFLDGASFDYHATPMQILKGRLILVLGLGLYMALGFLLPGTELILMLLVILSIPWLLVRSLIFRMRNTSYRNIRFDFRGSVAQSYAVAIKGGLVAIFTLGIGSFWADWLRSHFIIDNMRFGRTVFKLDCKAGDFFSIYLRMFGLSIIGFALLGAVVMFVMNSPGGSIGMLGEAGEGQVPQLNIWMVVTPIIFYLPLSLFLYSYLQAKKFNLMAATTEIGRHRLGSDLEVGKLFWIYLSNLFAVIVSIGLLIPWAKVRIASYRLQKVRVLVAGDLNQELAAESNAISAAGEEVGDYMDVDLGF